MDRQTASPRPEKSTNVRPESAPPAQLRVLRAGLGVLGAVVPRGAAAIAEHLFLSPTRHPRPEAERAALSAARHLLVPPASGTESEFDRDHLASWEWGLSGPRVLLVHGWEGRGAQLGGFAPPLVSAGYRVVTFDAPAHGSSPGSVSSILHFARAVERMAEAYGPFEGIVTHSMGGASTAWALRNGPLSKRLVMIAPPLDVRDFTRKLTSVLALGEPVRERIEERLARRFGVAPQELEVSQLGPRMTTPLLVVHDENDRDVPVGCGEAIAASWPGASFMRTRGLGHRRILRDAAVIDAAVRFILHPPALSTAA